jgi:hypothetical protein
LLRWPGAPRHSSFPSLAWKGVSGSR